MWEWTILLDKFASSLMNVQKNLPNTIPIPELYGYGNFLSRPAVEVL